MGVAGAPIAKTAGIVALAALTSCAIVLGLPDRGLDDLAEGADSAIAEDGASLIDGGGGGVSGDATAVVDAPNGDAADASCNADLTSDPLSCGQCNHDCLGGTCTTGRCQPFVFSTGTNPIGVLVDDLWVYVALENASIVRKRKSDRNGAAGTELVPSAEPYYLAVNPAKTTMYFTRQDNQPWISTFPIDGGPRTTLSSLGPTTGRGIVFFAGELYAVDTSAGALRRVDTTNGSSTLVKSYTAGGNPARIEGLAADATALYIAVTGANEVRRMMSPPADQLFETGATPSGVAVDETYVYFGEQTAGGGAVTRRRKDLSAPKEQIATTQGTVTGVAVDAQAVYWASRSTGRISRLAK